MAETSETQIPRCLTCDYALVGITKRCPECGRTFDANDPATMRIGRALSPLESAALKPPGKFFHGACVVAGLIALSANSVPGTYFGLVMLSVMLWLILGLTWVVRGIAYSVVLLRRVGKIPSHSFRRPGSWAIAPLIAVAVITSSALNVPLWIAFWASKGSMERFALQVMSTPTNAPNPGRLGVFRVSDYELVPFGMKFHVAGAGFLDRMGFAYLTQPSRAGDRRTEHFWGNWYIVQEDL